MSREHFILRASTNRDEPVGNSEEKNPQKWGKGYAFGVLLLALSQLWLIVLVPYISPHASDTHPLGWFFFSVADIFIRTLFGLGAFSIPLCLVVFGLHYLRGYENITITIQRAATLIISLFSFNLLLLNVGLVDSVWAGLFPLFFHALILHTFDPDGASSFFSWAIEGGFFLLSLLLVGISYQLVNNKKQWKMIISYLINLAKRVALVAKKLGKHVLFALKEFTQMFGAGRLSKSEKVMGGDLALPILQIQMRD